TGAGISVRVAGSGLPPVVLRAWTAGLQLVCAEGARLAQRRDRRHGCTPEAAGRGHLAALGILRAAPGAAVRYPDARSPYRLQLLSARPARIRPCGERFSDRRCRGARDPRSVRGDRACDQERPARRRCHPQGFPLRADRRHRCESRWRMAVALDGLGLHARCQRRGRGPCGWRGFLSRDDAALAELAALADYLARRREPILRAWHAALDADPELTSFSNLSPAQFNDHIPAVLDAFEELLRAGGVAEAAPPEEAQQNASAAEHGLHRWQQGYDQRQTMREWTHLQICLLGELERYQASRPALDARVLSAAH